MTHRSNIFLIGPRGSGKSCVGRLIAQKLGRKFVDTDELITQRAGKTIAEIFAQDGEQHFRELESQLLAEVASRSGQVVALGGGAILREANSRLIRSTGTVILLIAEPEQLWQRVTADAKTAADRPPLTDAEGLQEMRIILDRRRELYHRTAHAVVETSNLTVEQVAEQVLTVLQGLQRRT